MARQATILAFDDMKTASARSRPSVSGAKKQSKPAKRSSSGNTKRVTAAAPKKQSARTTSFSTATRKPLAKTAAKPKASKAAPAKKSVGAKSQKKRAAGASTSPKKSVTGSPKRTDPNLRSPVRNTSEKRQSAEPKNSSKQTADQKISKFSELKRTRSKNKADKAFTKQFAGKESSSASNEGAPRAALYKGEMGRSHKRATRAQGGKVASKIGAIPLPNISGLFEKNPIRKIGTLMVTACLVAACAFIYPTAKQFYVTNRQYDQLQAEYEALEDRNSTLRSEIDTLQTDAGVEDRAREEFGWVKEGENAVNVFGLENTDDETNYNKAITSGSVAAPESWYTPLLDLIFNV